MSWQENLLSDLAEIRNLIRQTKRIAVLGIKTDAQADQPSVYVPMYLKKTGFEIIPCRFITRKRRSFSARRSIDD